MQVLVVGASGRVGKALIQELEQAGHQVIGTRNSTINGDTNNLVALDLVHASVDEIAEKIQKMATFDAVYFVAGSRGKALLEVDLNGAVKLMIAMEQLGIKRYIQLSSYKADHQSEWPGGYESGLTPYNIAKFYADQWLQTRTSLAYTILQPGSLTEHDEITGVSLNDDQPGENTIPTVARVLAEVINYPTTIGKTIVMRGGDEDIKNALQTLH
ncbi:NAD(P)-binding oxidoreductase [Weissella koreensis]|uniref:SDR family oxidoreductase n=1 Tax=Weissella koreensis TaxID=165096 RepID=A0A7H1MNE9_9LACO|nr:NAD(P)-binding oxidoreductase [Weissella koreensis]AVH75783.1 nucleoside-diphosphate sugar epimerase [Weissella koreensis]QGN21004.1 NAD(P)H-binding protein [Weissella koreensis]QNT64985.1 SDR family oxidoreductase [Weissella koreensis]